MQTIVILALVFLIVWTLTALALWLEHKSRVAIEGQYRNLLASIAQSSASLANQAADMGLHGVLKERLRPLVHAAEKTGLPGKAKREQVLSQFQADHPGTPWEHVERAMEAVLKE